MTNATTTQPDAKGLYQDHVEQIMRREPEAWEHIYHAFRARLRQDIEKSLIHRGLPIDLINDVEQQTWVVAIDEIARSFRWIDEEHLYRWLRKISYNLIHEIGRGQNHTLSIEDVEANVSDIDIDQFFERYSLRDDSLEEIVDLRQRIIVIEKALRALKPVEREILVRRLMGEPSKMLAVIYGMKYDSLRTLLKRAKQKVLENLGQQLSGENDED